MPLKKTIQLFKEFLRGSDTITPVNLKEQLNIISANQEKQESNLSELEGRFRYFEQTLDSLQQSTDWLKTSTAQMLNQLDSLERSLSLDKLLFKDQYFDIALLQYLRAHIESQNCLDIGANIGDVSESLLAVGGKVFAFEPFPDTYRKLVQRFDNNTRFRALPYALGSSDGRIMIKSVEVDETVHHLFDPNLSVYCTAVEHPVPAGMKYGIGIEVPQRSLKSLHATAEIPEDIGMVKIDTEGNDLSVIKGMGSHNYPVVMTEFWDAKHYFSDGRFGLLHETVEEMRNKGYDWHVVTYKVLEGTNSSKPRFSFNISNSVENSWGNSFFFNDFKLFAAARDWCLKFMPVPF